VLPESLVALVVALHVLGQVRDEIALAVVLQEGGDVGVGAGGVAALRVGAVAVVGPEAVDGPRVGGAWIFSQKDDRNNSSTQDVYEILRGDLRSRSVDVGFISSHRMASHLIRILWYAACYSPVTGSVSQNWVCAKRPPGLLTQQVLLLEEAADEQLSIELEHDACARATVIMAAPAIRAERPKAILTIRLPVIELMELIFTALSEELKSQLHKQ
jgi:hypothetical protein